MPIWRGQDRDKSKTLTWAFCFPLQLLLSPERDSPNVSGENELVFGVQVTCQVRQPPLPLLWPGELTAVALSSV